MGAAGVNLVVVNQELLARKKDSIPAIMDYRQHIAAGSLMNTPPVFAVYVSMLTMRWIVEQGGLYEMDRRSREKSDLLYSSIDQNPLFITKVAREDRSRMNAVFFLADPQLEPSFLELCRKEGMVGVKGYRTIGGIRVSMYNALPLSSVQAFCELMKYFAEKNG
jgi:phosphoserine aminotransferase